MDHQDSDANPLHVAQGDVSLRFEKVNSRSFTLTCHCDRTALWANLFGDPNNRNAYTTVVKDDSNLRTV
jgi:hypothetical protein